MRIKEIHVGDPVRFTMAGRTLMGVVVEKRGPLGVNGAKVFRIAWRPEEEAEPLEFEISEDELELAAS